MWLLILLTLLPLSSCSYLDPPVYVGTMSWLLASSPVSMTSSFWYQDNKFRFVQDKSIYYGNGTLMASQMPYSDALTAAFYAPDEDHVYACFAGRAAPYKITLSTNGSTTLSPMTGACTGLSVSGPLLYALDADGTLYSYNINSLSTPTLISASNDAWATNDTIIFGAVQGRVFIGASTSKNVNYYTTSGTLKGTLVLPEKPLGCMVVDDTMLCCSSSRRTSLAAVTCYLVVV